MSAFTPETKALMRRAFEVMLNQCETTRYGNQYAQLHLKGLLLSYGCLEDGKSHVEYRSRLKELIDKAFFALSAELSIDLAHLRKSRENRAVTIRYALYMYILNGTKLPNLTICKAFGMDHTTGIHIQHRYDDEKFLMGVNQANQAEIHKMLSVITPILEPIFN